MSLIQQLVPINLNEEREKFFSNNCRYNPQFKYQNLITLRKREKYGRPKPQFIKLSKKIIKHAFCDKTESELRALEGPKISKKQGLKMLSDFLKQNNISEQIKVKWIKNHISKISHYQGTLKIRADFDFRKKKFLAALYHEVGTHAFRRFNYTKQPFFKKKDKHHFQEYLPTEEGLASLHSLLVRNLKLDYYHALLYLATDTALHGSFVDTFNFVNQYLQNKERSWRLTVKFKRGMYDTAEPGGFTKSIVYLEGMIKVWHYFQQTQFDVEGLYYGKIATDDVERARKMNPDFKPQLPTFYSKNKKHYRKKLKKISKINFFDQLDTDGFKPNAG